jgi:hypothetical protein
VSGSRRPSSTSRSRRSGPVELLWCDASLPTVNLERWCALVKSFAGQERLVRLPHHTSALVRGEFELSWWGLEPMQASTASICEEETISVLIRLHGRTSFTLQRQTMFQLHRSKGALGSSSGQLWKRFSPRKVFNGEHAPIGQGKKGP